MTNHYTVGNLIYDPHIYDGLNTNLDDLAFYKKWLPKNQEVKILELCCGTGRLTLPLANAGYQITGVDITQSMLNQALKKAKEKKLTIEFILGDMRTLELNEKFDCIFIPFNSIHHLYQNEDLFKTFEVVKKHLKPNGIFLFDCYNPNIHYICEAEKELQNIAKYITDDGREVEIKQQLKYEYKTQISRITWHYFINNQFDSIQNLDMRMYYPQEIDAYLKLYGFKIKHKFGSFDDNLFDNNSTKQIFVCECL